MPFELDTMTKAKLIDLEVLSQKNRQPDENPGGKLTVEMELGADMWAMFDGHLRSFLLEANAGKQGDLAGMASETLTAVGKNIGTIKWKWEGTGYRLVIDRGLGGRSNLEVLDCTLSGWRLTPKDGGFKCKVNIESADMNESAFGKLAKMKSREMQILLTPPEVQQEDIEKSPAPVKPARAKAAAKSAGEASKEALDAGGKSPFPKGGAKTDADIKTPESALAASVAGEGAGVH